MNCGNNFDMNSGQLQTKLQTIATDIQTLASNYQGNSLALLALLRVLEHSHREIRENLFQASLPEDRQSLYALLRDIEESGGWPYIDRLRLQSFLSNVSELADPTDDQTSED